MPNLKIVPFGIALITAIAAPLAFAGEAPDKVRQAIEKKIAGNLSGESVKGVGTTPMNGVYKVDLGQGRYLYSDGDGSHMIAGQMYEFGAEGLVNLADRDLMEMREKVLKDFDVADAIVFAPEGEIKAILNVFTDVDCGYCQLFHKQVPELNKAGVEIRYLAYPRAGIGSESYDKVATAWCADDPQKTLTALKNQESVKIDVCEDNPVAAEYEMGNEFGVRGTPSLVMMDGTLIPGYKPVDQLLVDLGINKQ